MTLNSSRELEHSHIQMYVRRAFHASSPLSATHRACSEEVSVHRLVIENGGG